MKKTIALIALAGLSLSAYGQGQQDGSSAKPATTKKATLRAARASSPALVPQPVLGKSQEACAYRPVMTKQDMDNCGINLGPRRLL